MPLTKNKTDTSLENLTQQQDQRVFDVYNIYRFVLSLILLISFFFRSLTSTLGTINPDLFVNVVVIYMAFNVIVFFRVLLPQSKGLLTSQFISVILIDIVFIILISYTCGGVSSGVANLLIVPVAAGSLLFR
jgi:two-component system sensor histidine kinase PilS (NtrC family)